MRFRVNFQLLTGVMMPFLKHLFPRTPRSSGNKLVTVVGSPLKLRHVENPSEADLDQSMQEYIAALRKLYDTYAPIYSSNKSRKLIIV